MKGRRNRQYESYYMANKDKYQEERSEEAPLFTSNFPAPPRRQVPSLHDVAFDDDNGVTFRHADSSTRALAALAQAKYERMERRRAATMLLFLIFTAISIYGTTHGYVKAAAGNIVEIGANLPTASGGTGGRGVRRNSGQDDKNVKADKLRGNSTSANAAVSDALEEDKVLSGFAGLAEISTPRGENDIPLFWHVPRAGGTSMKNAMGQCLGLVTASEGGAQGSAQNMEIEVIDVKGMKYVNVDTTTPDGINHAKELGLAQSGLSDIVISSFFFEAASIFTHDFPGRAFTLLRDPIERAVSMYYFRSTAYGDLQGVSIEDYAKGNGIENNWMTRFLTGQMEGELNKEQLELAKILLKRKFLVGFVDDIEESMFRFMKYNGWKFSDQDTEQLNQEECLKTLTQVGVNKNPMKYEMPQRGSQAYALITWQTQYDMKLYEYAKELFDKQTKTWGSKDRKKQGKKKEKKES